MELIKPKGNKQLPKSGAVIIDKSLNNLPIPAAAQRKNGEARAFLEKHPIPDHILNRHRSDK